MTDKKPDCAVGTSFPTFHNSEADFIEALHDAAMSRNPHEAMYGRLCKTFMPLFEQACAAEYARDGFDKNTYLSVLNEVVADCYATTLLNLAAMNGGVPTQEAIDSCARALEKNFRQCMKAAGEQFLAEYVKSVSK